MDLDLQSTTLASHGAAVLGTACGDAVAQIARAVSDITGRRSPPADLLLRSSIFELGIDSLSIVEFIFKLEEQLSIDIPLSELNEENFCTVATLAAHLDSIRAGAAAA